MAIKQRPEIALCSQPLIGEDAAKLWQIAISIRFRMDAWPTPASTSGTSTLLQTLPITMINLSERHYIIYFFSVICSHKVIYLWVFINFLVVAASITGLYSWQ